jgi:ribonuclease P protein subunit POP4
MVSLNPITPENIHRHELIGLKIEIIQSTDKQMIGLNGLVVDETKNMITIVSSKTDSNRVKIPKKDCIFRFSLSSGEQVDVDGRLLKLKPENRLKNVMRKRW